MSRTRSVARGARRLRTYAEFESYLTQFVAGGYPFLWIVGRPGVAKSESIAAALRGRTAYYRKGGQLTPFQFYCDCWHHRGQPIVLDDAEHILDDRNGAKLISSLGDTTTEKKLYWSSATKALGEVPTSFATTSSLCIIANKGTTHEAIQSRAITLHFDPTNLEIHRAVGRWFWDQEIHDWFGRHITRLAPIDTRWYVTAHLDKQAGRKWGEIVLAAHSQNRVSTILQDLEIDVAYPTREDKARRFGEVLGGDKGRSRATYFRLRKQLKQQGKLTVEQVEPIRLGRRRPPSKPTQAELDAMGGQMAAQREEEPGPADLPAHDAFEQPIRGNATPAQQLPQRVTVDDTTAMDARPADLADDGEDDDAA